MEYHSVKDVITENEELRLKLDALMSRFSGCGNCIHQDKECSSMLPKTQSFCEDYVLDTKEE